MLVVRLSKALLVLLIALFALLVGYNNIVDPDPNFEFVKHVLAMDTTFGGNRLRDRAITDPALQRAAYGMIIAGELLAGALCFAGAIRLFRAAKASARDFAAAKSLAIIGLVAGFAVWFLGFMTVGAEWFQMWQSPTWNGQQAAFRYIACIGIVLVFVAQEDRELG